MPIGERGKITTITDLSGNTYDLGAKYDADGNEIKTTYAKIADIPPGSTASSTTPKMDGTAAVGSETAFARGDHVHPSDTTKEDVSNKVRSVSSSSTHTEYPTAAAVQNALRPGYLTHSGYITIGYTTLQNSIIGMTSGLTTNYYRTITPGSVVDLSYPLLYWTGESVSSGITSQTNVNSHYAINSVKIQNNQACALGDMIYIVGTLNGNILTIDSSTMFTNDPPNFEDGKVYIPIGIAMAEIISGTGCYLDFKPYGQIFEYRNGAFRPLVSGLDVFNNAISELDDKLLEMISGTIWSLSDMQNTPRALSDGEYIIGEVSSGEWSLIQIMDDLIAGYDLITQPMWEAVTVGGSLYYIINQLALKENLSNKVTSLSSSSTNTQYPSAKAVYDEVHGLPELYSTAFDNVDMLATALTLDRGLYYFKATCTNRPTSTSGRGFACIVNRRAVGASEFIQLIATDYSTGETYTNVFNQTAWDGWKLLNSDDFVSKSGDTMTGALAVKSAGTTNIQVANTGTNAKTIDLMCNASNGCSGLYDRTNSQWMVYSNYNGNIVVPSHLPLSGGLDNALTGYLYMRNTDITKGTNPSSDAGRSIRVMQNTTGTSYNGNDVLGQLAFIITSSGVSQANLMAYKNVANTAHWAALRTQISSNGTAAPYFVTNTDTNVANVIWHAGNAPGLLGAYANADNNNSITITNTVCYGYIDNSSKRVTFLIPYNIIGGTVTCSALSIRLYLVEGGNPYFRSGSNGGTYTQDNSTLSIWANSKTVRTNEVASVTAVARTRAGIQVVVNFTYAMTINNTGTAVTSNCPVTVYATGTFAIS